MTKTTFRCAVYTRKSHEEGLEQEFNSLDAQLEACRSYIASQAGLGWSYRETRYDDGGISGGHMNRPALQALVSDIKAGLVDIIVVYKVDRLTRSLPDFAKLVDVFDAHDVSFVSVTQAFNTTTSMGRLTLNVLLSFAQFEREVTAERIRDKIKASKKRGMWMGGTIPLGFYTKDRKLYPSENEVPIVETLFKLYAKHKTVSTVAEQAAKLGLTTRPRTTKDGSINDGKAFTRGHIYYILNNPIYIGKIRHKTMVHDGNHKSIIGTALWETVQATLKANKADLSRLNNCKSAAVLGGLLFDEQGHDLTPHYSVKSGKRYHYYVSQNTNTDDNRQKWRLPAKMIEGTVCGIMKDACQNPNQITSLDQLPPKILMEAMKALGELGTQIGKCAAGSDNTYLRDILHRLIGGIRLSPDKIVIELKPHAVLGTMSLDQAVTPKLAICKPLILKRRGHELKIALGGELPRLANHNAALIKRVAQGYALRKALETEAVASIKDYAAQNRMDTSDARRLLPLGYLAPEIVKSILSGQQPVDLTAELLKDSYKLAITWKEQRQYLGFPA